MRDFLDNILSSIGAALLSNDEFDTVTAEFTILDQATYDDLARIISARGGVSTDGERLIAYYKANAGLNMEPVVDSTNLWLGSVIE